MVIKMDDFILMPLSRPLILRGVSLNQQTQVGFCGTPLQVLHQQGYMAEKPSLLFVPTSLLRKQTRIHGGLNQDHHKKSYSADRAHNIQDAEGNEDTTNA